MEINYIFELLIIFIGLRVIHSSYKAKALQKTALYILFIFVFATFQYFMVCGLASASPIYSEILFNTWIFLFAMTLGKTLEATWKKASRFKTALKIIFIVTFLMLIFGLLNTRRAKIDVRFTPKTYNFKYTESFVKTSDGLNIRSWFIKGHLKNDKVAIVSHGIGANLGDSFPFALKFLIEGYDVITFDWRSHGLSDGHLIEFGEGERFDIQAILSSYQKELDGYSTRVAFGASMGGGNIIKNWDLYKQSKVTRLILDSPYADVRDAVIQKLWFLPFPESIKWHISNLTCRLASIFINTRSVSNPPIQNISKLKDTPVLLIHGKKDILLPYQGSQRLFDQLDPKISQLAIFDKAGHLNSHRKHRKEYEKVFTEFLNR
ncbi:MAG: alpha/beta hydrolase [Candidatus Cloacimonetes bacterium]|nr:alpha/beta hydrolase [Candidatus Cloacimonadota bacterium]